MSRGSICVGVDKEDGREICNREYEQKKVIPINDEVLYNNIIPLIEKVHPLFVEVRKN